MHRVFVSFLFLLILKVAGSQDGTALAVTLHQLTKIEGRLTFGTIDVRMFDCKCRQNDGRISPVNFVLVFFVSEL